MLEVGNMPSYAEDEAHFGLWCITSSPLILGTPISYTHGSIKGKAANADPDAR